MATTSSTSPSASPSSLRRRRAPQVPAQLFPTSYADLEEERDAAHAASSSSSCPSPQQQPSPPLPHDHALPHHHHYNHSQQHQQQASPSPLPSPLLQQPQWGLPPQAAATAGGSSAPAGPLSHDHHQQQQQPTHFGHYGATYGYQPQVQQQPQQQHHGFPAHGPAVPMAAPPLAGQQQQTAAAAGSSPANAHVAPPRHAVALQEQEQDDDKDEDIMGLYNRPAKAPRQQQQQQAADAVMRNALEPQHASPVQHEREQEVKRPVSRKSTPVAGRWHWRIFSRLFGLLFLCYFAGQLAQRYHNYGPAALVHGVFNLHIFVLFAAVGMIFLSPTLIGTSLVVLGFDHISWAIDIVAMSMLGYPLFGTATETTALATALVIGNFTFDLVHVQYLSYLVFHVLFVPVCLLVLYKNGGVQWRAGFFSFVLHSLLFLVTVPLPPPFALPSVQDFFSFPISPEIYEQLYRNEQAPAYQHYLQNASPYLKQALTFSEENGHEHPATVPAYIHLALWILLCNFVTFVLLKSVSIVFLQRTPRQQSIDLKKKKTQ